jgi:hypothetical protein
MKNIIICENLREELAPKNANLPDGSQIVTTACKMQ